MSDQFLYAGVEKKTPIERIFKKVMRREMTAEERKYFHLKAEGAHGPGKHKAGAMLHRKTDAQAARQMSRN